MIDKIIRITAKSGVFPLMLTAAAVLGILCLASCEELLSPNVPGGSLVPKTVAEDPNLSNVTIEVAGRERKIHYHTAGDPSDPPLLLMHGSLSDMRGYLPLAAELSERYYVILWDLRGNGLSERVSKEELGFDAMVEEIEAVREYFCPGRTITLLGYSWSADFAALYAGTYPENLDQLILVEPTGLKSDFQNRIGGALNLATEAYMDMVYTNEFITPRTHELIGFQSLAMLKSAVRDFFCNLDDLPPWPVWRVGGYALMVWEAAVMSGPSFDFDFTGNLDSFEKPVLFIGSSCSPIGYEFQETYNMTVFSNAQSCRIEGAGHRMIAEKYDEFVAGLKSFLMEYKE